VCLGGVVLVSVTKQNVVQRKRKKEIDRKGKTIYTQKEGKRKRERKREREREREREKWEQCNHI